MPALVVSLVVFVIASKFGEKNRRWNIKIIFWRWKLRQKVGRDEYWRIKTRKIQTAGSRKYFRREVKVLQRIADESKNIFGADSNDYLQALNELGGTQKYIGHYAVQKKI